VAAVAREVSVEVVAAGERASDGAVRGPSSHAASLQGFAVIRGPSLDHSIRPNGRCGDPVIGTRGAFAGLEGVNDVST
jgi:hypothetical protein